MIGVRTISRRVYLGQAAALCAGGMLAALHVSPAGAQGGATEVAQDLGDGTAQNWQVYPDGRRVPVGCRWSLATGECVGAGATAEIPAPITAQLTREPVTLRVSVRTTNTVDFLKVWTKQFSARDPNVKFDLDAAYGNFDKLIIYNAANTLPDVLDVWQHEGWMSSFAFSGALRAIDDLVQADSYDLTQFFAPAVQGSYWEGKLWGIPTGMQPNNVFIFYNQNLFDAAGLKYPSASWTLDDVVETARKLTRRSGDTVERAGLEVGFGSWSDIVRMRRFGGEFMSADGKKMLLDTPESIAATQWLYDLMWKYQVNDRAKWHWFEGETAMYIGATYQFAWVDTMAKNNIQMGVELLPPGPTGKSTGLLTGYVWALTRQVRNLPWAWVFMKEMVGKEAGVVAWLTFNSQIGSRPDVWADPRIRGHKFGPWLTAAAERVFPISPPAPVAANLRTKEVWNIYDTNINRLLGPGPDLTTPAIALPAVGKAMQAILDRPR